MQRTPYPSDLTDEQWRAVEPLIPAPQAGGRRREVDVREVVNAIRYLHATNCGWRGLPTHFPNRSTVRYYSDVWRRSGVWEQIVAAADFGHQDGEEKSERTDETS
ncbi:Transposase OS=Gloeobacter kilaueensis JS1 GN=GKIL_1308 PE=4 SV=1: DUF4096 [Gemmata massiliana]|uniref:Insertion element IS402-like domain-containing protein n=1 Tax=Gemmata massiliana TaxID=1210884 RepID=A0A6P2DLU1_9BACT|nr:transposase [Gemmata massiliana]VTS01819.1 Transposase OS=Gloeobacter kilaueensis JS1 GN=GKIL_1308 PE=4 SV=1: DUF4096 [Gemmata massiliana]